MAGMDIAAGINAKKIAERLPYWYLVRTSGTSGFQMAGTLNYFFHEYFTRIVEHGPDSLPTSANIGQDFLTYDAEYFVLDKREEREHLLTSDAYFDWYGKNDMPKEPSILKTVMDEGVVYSYEMTLDRATPRLRTDHSELVVVGMSLVRHADYLSCILVSGENPPDPSDEEIKATLKKDFDILPGKEWLQTQEQPPISERYLAVLPGFSRVNLLARFDLVEKKYESRYLGRDIGHGFLSSTDDARELESIQSAWPAEVEKYAKHTKETLDQYGVLFSALTSFIYLPLMFISEIDRVSDTKFATEMLTRQHDPEIKKAIQLLGEKGRRYYCTVKCLQSIAPVSSPNAQISPPDMEFETAGFWRKLAANEIGADKDGNPIVGRTWTERHDVWHAPKPTSFLIQSNEKQTDGPDPGVVYIVSSPAYGADVYKVGLTRRNADQRAKELSSATGVALPFGVVANWEVGDCAAVEKAVHHALNWCRLSSRREFFYTKLSTIVEVVQQAIAKT
jgi:hypothetical protein